MLTLTEHSNRFDMRQQQFVAGRAGAIDGVASEGLDVSGHRALASVGDVRRLLRPDELWRGQLAAELALLAPLQTQVRLIEARLDALAVPDVGAFNLVRARLCRLQTVRSSRSA